MTSVLESEPPSGAEPPDPLRILYLANGFPLAADQRLPAPLLPHPRARPARPSDQPADDRADRVRAGGPGRARTVHRADRDRRLASSDPVVPAPRPASTRVGVDRRERGSPAPRRGRDGGRDGPPRRGPVQWSSDLPGPRGGDRDADRGRRVRCHVEPDPRQPALRLDRPAATPPGRVHRGEPRRAALVRDSVRLLFASVRDRDALLPPEDRDRATILPNGVDLDFWRRPAGAPLGRGEIVFTGAMDYPPNTDAALYLIRRPAPRVRAEVPTAHLSIVGRDPTDPLSGRAGAPGRDGHRARRRRAALPGRGEVFAAPLRFGAGTRTRSSRRWRWASRPWPAPMARPA